jgi:hypothetical protein
MLNSIWISSNQEWTADEFHEICGGSKEFRPAMFTTCLGMTEVRKSLMDLGFFVKIPWHCGKYGKLTSIVFF